MGQGAIRHRLEVRKDDFYATCPEAVTALIACEPKMPEYVWEPACGDGAIVLPLRQTGRTVVATDLVARGCPDSVAGRDFLFWQPQSLFPPEGIVTNPPYKLATRFIELALERADYVAMLLRLGFLASQERKDLFSRFARLHVSSRRLPMMHRGDYAGEKASSQVDYAWFVWDARHVGEPVIRWFDWREL
jgi:hypothetical protein